VKIEPLQLKPPRGTPCGECPFRRTSMAGYLGPHRAKTFLMMALSDGHMPCHLEHGDGRGQVEDAHQCSGRAIFMANSCKVPADDTLVRLTVDRKTVLGNSVEFLEHHGQHRHIPERPWTDMDRLADVMFNMPAPKKPVARKKTAKRARRK